MSEKATCAICGEPMPPGEEMFKYHGYSGPCPAPPLPRPTSPLADKLRARWLSESSAVIDGDGGVYHGQLMGEASTLMIEAADEIDRLTRELAAVRARSATANSSGDNNET